MRADPKRTDRSARAADRRLFRSSAEAAVSALVVALLLKAFVLEAYTIPSGSMQPTLLGWTAPDGGAVKDRVLVDRLAYLRGDPQRFDVAVFRFPLDRSRAFVKRVWGLPGDVLRIADGDVQRRDAGGAWRPLRRSDSVMDEMWLELDEGSWGLARGRVDWQTRRVLAAEGALDLVYPRGSAEEPDARRVVDLYRDGYPPALDGRIPQRGGQNVVGDLRIELSLHAPDDQGAAAPVVRISIGEGPRAVYVATLDPRAGATLEVPGDGPPRVAAAPLTFPLRLALENLDDRVRLLVDGETLLEAEVPAVTPTRAWVRIEAGGALGGAAGWAEGLQVLRDVHYVLGRAATDTWSVPAGHYFLLGDNTQASVDSREWRLSGYEFEDGDRVDDVVLGQVVQGVNPRTSLENAEGPEWYFRDEWGERQRIPTWQIRMPPPIEAPFVPRDHMLGRAFAVLWPVGEGLERPKWIR